MYDICMKCFVDGYYNLTAHGKAQVLENYNDQPTPVCLETPVAPNMDAMGCDQSQLAAVARLVNIKVEHNIAERCYEQVSQWASDLLPRNHTLPSNYYNTKKMIRDLGFPIEKIHTCKNDCMLYWKDEIDMEYCKFYGDNRYKPTKDQNSCRKKSLYAAYVLATYPTSTEVVCFTSNG
ncbi:UNVERIFIED_CONTAM: hypothetical protein Sradi_0039700 [Sesamum radiatum]|uniref:SCP domain-containing protein n=1 Tax=Sesamum radiatum TaxID=300843 RepID=A0AAW2WHM6_SESRA